MTGCLDVTAADAERRGLGAVALRYQALGYAVLGLGVGSKRPHRLNRGGVYWASLSPAAVAWMWGQDKMAGIGVATGAASRLVVIDLDVKNGENGTAEFQAFLARWSLAIPGPGLAPAMVATPSGGWHIWLRTPPGWPVPGRRILPGVEIKGDGGYVVAAPSRVRVDYDDQRGGGSVLLPYAWTAGCPCAVPPAPEWLLRWITEAPAAGGPNGEEDHEALPDLAQLYATGLPVGERNIALHRLACQQFARLGAGSAAARSVIDTVLAATDCRGFGRAEIERTIASARAFIARREAEDIDAWQAVYGRR